MPWPKLWSSSTKDEKPSEKAIGERVNEAIDSAVERVTSVTDAVPATQKPTSAPSTLQVFTQPQTIVAATILTVGSLGVFKFYRSFLRRIPEATNISPQFFRKRSILGKVTSVGDGDNFRIYHTPGGWLAGWGWLPWRRVPVDKKDLKNNTVRVTLCVLSAGTDTLRSMFG
jgi:hypothetical protein